jgi:hypothetical protein
MVYAWLPFGESNFGTYQVLKTPGMADRLKSELKTAWPDIRQSPLVEALD